MGVAWLCGPTGLTASVASWDVGRLAEMAVMWSLMSVATMLPCSIAGALLGRRPLRLPFGALAAGAAAGALAQWALESGSLGGTAVDGAFLSVALISAVVAIEIARWRRQRQSTGAFIVQMTALHLAGIPMDPLWMLVVTLWMLAGEIGRHRSAPSVTALAPRAD